jgi:hypothetical protein
MSISDLPARRLTLKQAAERAGVSQQLISRWCDQLRLPHSYRYDGRRGRGRILIDPTALDRFLETLKVTPRPPGDDEGFRQLLADAAAAAAAVSTGASAADSRRLRPLQ